MRRHELESANILEPLFQSSFRVRRRTVKMRDEVRRRVMTVMVVQSRETGSLCDSFLIDVPFRFGGRVRHQCRVSGMSINDLTILLENPILSFIFMCNMNQQSCLQRHFFVNVLYHHSANTHSTRPQSSPKFSKITS
jgi:hypothetical protein